MITDTEYHLRQLSSEKERRVAEGLHRSSSNACEGRSALRITGRQNSQRKDRIARWHRPSNTGMIAVGES